MVSEKMGLPFYRRGRGSGRGRPVHQGGSINIIQVTLYSFTVHALKLMKVKLCLFLATTALCHDRAAIKFISLILVVFLMIT